MAAAEETEEAEPPNKPRNLTGTVSHDQVQLSWDAPKGGADPTGYQVLRRDRQTQDAGDFSVLVDDTDSTATATAYTATDTDVQAEGRDTYRVKARNEAGLSSMSNFFDANLPESPEPELPASPTGLSGAATHKAVSLTWDDPNDETITGYQVLRQEGSDFETLVPDTGSASLSYTDDYVEPGTTYVYAVRARNEAGLSGQSNHFEVETPQPPAVTVSFEQATYTVGEGQNVSVAILLDVDPERSVTIPLTVSNQDGASYSDYSAVPSEVTFNSGDTRLTITITATDDGEDDDGESLVLALGNLSGRVTPAPRTRPRYPSPTTTSRSPRQRRRPRTKMPPGREPTTWATSPA